jgi:radical SAM superfamily enzyme YgiQ (UPF0313 family)
MKILFIQTNTYRFLNPSPIGASLVARALQKAGHAVMFLDLMFEKNPNRAVQDAIKKHQPELICYSVRNRDNMTEKSFFDPMPGIKLLMQSVRHVSSAPFLLGGTAFTTYPKSMLLDTGADYGIAGDDLENVTRFVASLESGKPDLSTPGLVYRSSHDVVVENPFKIVGYRNVDFDNYSLVDLKKYRRGYWQAGVVTRTGCNEKCAFCDTFHTFGRDFVLREPRQIASEILALKKTGLVRSIFLIDAGFNRPLDFGKSVLEEIIRQRAFLRLNAIFDPGHADREFFKLFKRAGGLMMTLFAESLSDPVLKALGKSFCYDDILSNVNLMHETGVPFFFMPTFGSPGETKETVQETLSRLPKLKAPVFDFSIGWRIQARAPLFDIAVKEGLIDADDDCYRAKFYVSPHVSREWIQKEIARWKRRHILSYARLIPFGFKYITQRPWRQRSE